LSAVLVIKNGAHSNIAAVTTSAGTIIFFNAGYLCFVSDIFDYTSKFRVKYYEKINLKSTGSKPWGFAPNPTRGLPLDPF
jgi:hypothetical protein